MYEQILQARGVKKNGHLGQDVKEDAGAFV
jgi:hypothetical protein